MKKFVFQILLLLVVTFVAIYIYKAGSVPNVPFMPQPAIIKTLIINNTRLKVEIADTKDKRSKGLSGRDKLATDEGMLFTFDKADKYPFWMKGMNFSLDFVWIRQDTVLDTTENVKPPLAGQTEQSLPIYTSKADIDKVLEISGGTVNKLNIKSGDKVLLE